MKARTGPAMSYDSRRGMYRADFALSRLGRHLSLPIILFPKVDQYSTESTNYLCDEGILRIGSTSIMPCEIFSIFDGKSAVADD